MRVPFRSLATLLLAAGVATCSDHAPTSAKASPAGRARVDFVPVFSAAARAAAAKLADFGITFDHVRVVIVRPVADTVKDTTVTFAPGQTDITLDLTVSVKADRESFNATIDYTSGGGVVFHGTGTVQSHAPDQPAPTQQITVQYAGPGAAVTHLAVSPKTVALVAPTTSTFTVAALDANNAPVPNTPINWATSDATVATISNTGILTTTGKRGTVTVTATTITNATDNATATISLPPAGIVLISGGGQTGKVGAALAQPAVVRVTASDGVGVGGIPVTFAAPVGGKVGAASVVTDVNGMASTSLTLGGAVGPQAFAAVALGLTVAIPATATAGDPATIVAVSGGGQSDTVKHALKLPLVAKVSDAFGNVLPNVTVNWSRTTGGGTLSAPTSITNSGGQASIDYTLGAAVGTESITASVSGVPGVATFTETAVSAGAAAIAIVSGDAQTARIQQSLAPFVVKVTDAGGNAVSDAKVTWTATNGTMAATTTTDVTGTSSNIMTLGSAAGTASATASIGTAAVAFSATVQTGLVTRLVIRTSSISGASGVPITPPVRVELRDAGGNLTAATNAVTIALATNPPGGILTGTLTRNGVAGIATFDDLKIDKAGGGYSFLASSAGLSSATTATFAIGAGTPATLVILAGDAQFATVNTPVSVAPSVKLLDASSNPVSGVGVTFTPPGGSGSALPATVTTDASGIATLTSWTLGILSGPQTLVVGSAGVPNVTLNATATAGAPTHLAVVATPTTQAAGGTSSVTAQLLDAFNNTVPTAGRTINWTSTGGGSFASPSNVTGAGGSTPPQNFTTSTTSGVTHTITATDAGAPTVIGTATVTTVPGAASKLAITTQPSASAQSGIAFPTQPVVQLQDGFGNAVALSGATVNASVATGAGTLGGTMSAVTDALGRATFTSLQVTGVIGSRTLSFTSTGLTPVSSATIAVAAGPPAALAFSVNPTGTTTSTAITPAITVNVNDASGNLVLTAGNSVTLAITPGTGASGAVLSGTTLHSAASGVASFSGLSIDAAGTAYTLTATSPGLASAVSATFDIAGSPSLTVVSSKPAAGAIDVQIDSIVRIQFSAAINPATLSASTVSVTVGGNPVAGALAVSGGTTVIFTPSARLTEFKTSYVVHVTTGLKSTLGNFLATPLASTFTTAFTDPDYYYSITNQLRGPTEALDTYNDSYEAFFSSPIGGFSGQYWYFVPIAGTPYMYMKNSFLGDGFALEGAAPGTNSLMTGLAPTGGYFTGQAWTFTPIGPVFPNGYRLQNQNLGPAQSLGYPLIGGEVNLISMTTTGPGTDQVWYFNRLAHR